MPELVLGYRRNKTKHQTSTFYEIRPWQGHRQKRQTNLLQSNNYNTKVRSHFTFHVLRCKFSKLDLQTEFWNIFYTILNYFDPCVSLEASELSENLKIN